MFDLSIYRKSEQELYLASAGKNVHANIDGYGGNLYFFDITL